VVLACLGFTLAACSSGPAPTATPDPALAGKWEYAGYQVDRERMTVFARLYGPGQVSATLEADRPSDRAEGGENGGIRRFIFENVPPGRHPLRLTGAGDLLHLRTVWMPPAQTRELPAGERITLKPGDGFLIRAGELTVVFTGALGDSRCPVGVTCIQAGETNLSFTAYSTGVPVLESVISPPRDQAGGELIAGFLLIIHSVSPERMQDEQPDFSKYEVTVSFAAQS
jgi:hypothetical protein